MSVAFSPDGRTIASASEDRSVRLWSAATGELMKTLQGHTLRVYSVAFSPDGSTIISASEDKSVRLWTAGINVRCSVQSSKSLHTPLSSVRQHCYPVG